MARLHCINWAQTACTSEKIYIYLYLYVYMYLYIYIYIIMDCALYLLVVHSETPLHKLGANSLDERDGCVERHRDEAREQREEVERVEEEVDGRVVVQVPERSWRGEPTVESRIRPKCKLLTLK